MGNNHEQYFGKQKRKILILGLEGVGKSTLLNYLVKGKPDFNTKPTKNLNIEDVKVQDLQVSFFDMAGAERQRVFWKQQYAGTQGILFLLDASSPPPHSENTMKQLAKVVGQFERDVPVDQLEPILWGKCKLDLNKKVETQYQGRQARAFEVDYKNPESIREMLSWLLQKTQAI